MAFFFSPNAIGLKNTIFKEDMLIIILSELVSVWLLPVLMYNTVNADCVTVLDHFTKCGSVGGGKGGEPLLSDCHSPGAARLASGTTRGHPRASLALLVL